MSKSKPMLRCCIIGCQTTEPNNYSVSLYRFPGKSYEIERKEKWVKAVNRMNADGSAWQPSGSSRICSLHFVGEKKSTIANHPSYLPTIFPKAYHKKTAEKKVSLAQYERAVKRRKTLPDPTNAIDVTIDSCEVEAVTGTAMKTECLPSISATSTHDIVPVASTTIKAESLPSICTIKTECLPSLSTSSTHEIVPIISTTVEAESLPSISTIKTEYLPSVSTANRHEIVPIISTTIKTECLPSTSTIIASKSGPVNSMSGITSTCRSVCTTGSGNTFKSVGTQVYFPLYSKVFEFSASHDFNNFATQCNIVVNSRAVPKKDAGCGTRNYLSVCRAEFSGFDCISNQRKKR